MYDDDEYVINQPRQLSLAIPARVGKLAVLQDRKQDQDQILLGLGDCDRSCNKTKVPDHITGDGQRHRWGRNGEF